MESKITIIFNEGCFIARSSETSRELFDKSAYGAKQDNGTLKYMAEEALFLAEKNKAVIVDLNNKEIEFNKLIRKLKKYDKKIALRFAVYKDLRDRGYVVKSGLKFGAEFRVYDKGIKPGDDHAKWVVFPVSERESLTWYEFAAKNRVANSTKKKLLIAIADEEGDVIYYECRWVKP